MPCKTFIVVTTFQCGMRCGENYRHCFSCNALNTFVQKAKILLQRLFSQIGGQRYMISCEFPSMGVSRIKFQIHHNVFLAIEPKKQITRQTNQTNNLMLTPILIPILKLCDSIIISSVYVSCLFSFKLYFVSR